MTAVGYIVAGPDAIYGAGADADGAIADACELAGFDPDQICSWSERQFAKEGLYYQEATQRLLDYVAEFGTPKAWRETDDGVADLITDDDRDA